MDEDYQAARLKAVNLQRGVNEILKREIYLERGNIVLLANQTALNMDPRRDIPYPDWNIRYVNTPGGHGKDNPDSLDMNAMGFIFSDPKLETEWSGDHWSIYNFTTRKVYEMARRGEDPLGFGCVARIYVSVKTGTLIINIQDAEADFDPDSDTTRLYCSELMYQAWHDACTVHLTSNPGESHLRKLKYVIIHHIINHGTLWTIQDALISQGVSPVSILQCNDEKGTFTSCDDNTWSDEFKMLLGTANGRCVARMCADHAQTLGKQVKKVYARIYYPAYIWDRDPEDRIGALIFELEEVQSSVRHDLEEMQLSAKHDLDEIQPPASQSNLPKRKQSNREKVKAFSKSVVGSIKKRF
ncbi:hypothetical protein EAF04_006143 [Stromatinia cepivora]|nr:hypothetical protein EAF04_006143 [Stromatinia cepivora]